jgi:hypothetical protein
MTMTMTMKPPQHNKRRSRRPLLAPSVLPHRPEGTFQTLLIGSGRIEAILRDDQVRHAGSAGSICRQKAPGPSVGKSGQLRQKPLDIIQRITCRT